MTKDDALRNLTHAALRENHDRRSVLACMMVLHTCDFHLAEGAWISDIASSTETSQSIRAVTRRHAAELVAEVVSRSDVNQGMMEWYFAYCTETPFECVESIPAAWSEDVNRVRDAILSRCHYIAEIAPAE